MKYLKYLPSLALFFGLPIMASAAFTYWDPEDTATVPKTLSAMGLYSTISAKKNTFIPTVNHFQVNSPLWSDGSHKNRWFLIKPNTKIGFKLTDDYFDFPDSTVFIKQFDIDTVLGDTTSRVRWETRILINKKYLDSSSGVGVLEDQWYGYSYKWNTNQLDAKLVSNRGAKDSIRVYPTGLNNPSRMKKWKFPERGGNGCAYCHRVGTGGSLHGRSVLGFFTAQLNGPHPDSANINQLEYFFKKNLFSFTGTKPTNWNDPTVPKWAGIADTTASVDLRARSYIAANCSGCHGDRGISTGAPFGASINYDYHTMISQMEFRNRFVQATWGVDTLAPFFYNKTTDALANPKLLDSLTIEPALVVPHYPSKSAILTRQKARNLVPGNYDGLRAQMPPVGSYEVNDPAMAVITKWIAEMPQIPAPHCCDAIAIRFGNLRSHLKSPVIEGRTLRLPPQMLDQKNGKVLITNINGQVWELKKIGEGSYQIPGNFSAGIYSIRIGQNNFTQYLF